MTDLRSSRSHHARFAGYTGAALAWALLNLAGCTAVGPDYQGPPTVAERTLGQSPLASDAGGEAADQALGARWWLALNDDTLSELIEQAWRASPTLHAAEARLRASRASHQQQEANGQPSVSASALGAGLWKGPGTGNETSLQLYSTGFDASWEVDLFGGTRRAVEASSAQAQAVQADLADAQVSLAAEVASTYVSWRAQQRQQVLLQQRAASDQQALTLMQQRLRSGVVQPDEVEQYVQRIEATGGNLADLTADMAATLGRLTLLTGQEPGALDARLTRAGATLPTVPARVAVGDPAALLQRRPDIRAAERRLAGRSAQIGQQKANYFPKLRLLGDIGFSGTDAAQVLRADSLSLIAVPYLSWNVLDFGRTAAAVRQAEANRDEALANYQETVLAALQDANTALARFGQQRQSVQHLLAQQASSQRLLDVTVQRRQAGVATQIDVLDAQRRHADAQLNVLNGETQLLKHYVALQKSLGLGWRLPG